MAVPIFDKDVEIISKQSDDPRKDLGYSSDQFKAQFDVASGLIKEYINTVLVPAMNAINAGAVHVGPDTPVVTPCLWFKTAEDQEDDVSLDLSADIKYVDENGDAFSISLSSVDSAIASAMETVAQVREELKAVQVSLPVSGWSAEEPFTQTVAVEGMTAAWEAGYFTVVSNEDMEVEKAMREAAGCLAACDTGEGTMTFTCFEDKPECDVTILVHGALGVSADG